MTGQQVHGHTQEMARLTVNETAKELGISRRRVMHLIEIGDLPATNVAPPDAARKTWRVDDDDLRQWVASRSNKTSENGA